MSGQTANRVKDTARSVATKVETAATETVNNPAQAKQDFLHLPLTRAALPFVNGGLAGMTATAVIQPIDMVKVRLQLAGEGVKTGPRPSALGITKDIIAQGRVLDLYNGLSAGLLRQAVYTTARLGFFDTFSNTLSARAKEKGKTISFGERAAAGLSAGGLAAMVGNPADLALIRMQSDGLKPKEARANYKSVFDALIRISKNEGIGALWAGAYPTVVRAMALNFGQLTFFAESKQQLKKLAPDSNESLRTFGASAIAGFFASFFSLPFDFVKTRLQKQSKGPDGKLPYAGMADCARKVIKDEGWLRFYRGFGTYYVRIAPHAYVKHGNIFRIRTDKKQNDYLDRCRLSQIDHYMISCRCELEPKTITSSAEKSVSACRRRRKENMKLEFVAHCKIWRKHQCEKDQR